MFAEDFDPAKALAARCPRCRTMGLLKVDSQAHRDAGPDDVRQPRYIVSPGLSAKCPACGLFMEWPECCDAER
jgi:hypothetical protein